MRVEIVNNAPNVRVTTSENDGTVIITLSPEGCKALGEHEPGAIIKLGKREYIVLQHLNGVTAVIAKDFVKKMAFGKTGDYLNSDIRAYLNNDFYKEIGMERIVIIKHTGDGKYIFRVPDGRTLKAGDMVLCQTRRGIVPGMCCCDSFDTDKVDTIKSAFGAPTNTPLAPIVGEYQYNMWGDQHFDEVVAAELMDFDTVMNRGAV